MLAYNVNATLPGLSTTKKITLHSLRGVTKDTDLDKGATDPSQLKPPDPWATLPPIMQS